MKYYSNIERTSEAKDEKKRERLFEISHFELNES